MQNRHYTNNDNDRWGLNVALRLKVMKSLYKDQTEALVGEARNLWVQNI
jgi:hypothetical protein